MIIFAKYSILDTWQGSEYTSGLIELLCNDSKRDTQEGWYLHKTHYSIQTKLRIFPYLFWSQTWKCNIHANGRLTKIKEKCSTIEFDVFVFSFFFFLPMSQTISVINRGGMCYFYELFEVANLQSICSCKLKISWFKNGSCKLISGYCYG